VTSADPIELLAERDPVTRAVRDELAARVGELRPELPVGHLELPREVRRSRRRVLLLGAAVAVAVAVALAAVAPWRGGPTILDRAAAAVLAPADGQILYESITIGRISGVRGGVIHVHVWIEGASPGRFRVTYDGPGQPGDVGGTLGGVTGLSYFPADGVLDPVAFYHPISQSDLDPAAFIKKALTSGRAQLQGRTTLRGRDVVRIRLSSRFSGRLTPIAIYLVDARTYRPVRITMLATTRPDPYLLGFPLGGDSLAPYRPVMGLEHSFVCDFAQYRYLAPTRANQKLANIQSVHPHAKIV
jgi:hypothetical protein